MLEALKILIFRNFPQISLVSTLNGIVSGYPVIMILNAALMAFVEPEIYNKYTHVITKSQVSSNVFK